MSLIGSISEGMLRFARQAVEAVTSGLVQQISIVEEQALSPLRTILQQVIGTMWIGEGADAFAEEISSMVIPGIGAVADNIGWLNTGISRAGELISAADRELLAAINEFDDVCSNIF
jgi:hypothetical protein